MADTPVSAPFVFNTDLAKARIKEVTENTLAAFAGKSGGNPYLWLNKNVKPLNDRVSKGEKTKDLYDEIMALTVPKSVSVDVSVVNK